MMKVLFRTITSGFLLCALLGWRMPDSCLAGTLSATFAAVASNSVVDLTAQGPLDWVHWGLNTEYGFDRKVSVVTRIGTLTPIIAGGGEGPYQYADNLNGYSWIDGIPNTFATNTLTGIYAIGKGSGFELTVPADTVLRRLKVYVGAFGAQGQFHATLSDNSAVAYTDSSIDNASSGPGGAYTISYAAGSTGQVLTIDYVVAKMHDNRVGNVTWQAAALANASSNNPPTATLTGPTDNSVFAAPASVSLAAIASDSDGTIAKVEFFQGNTKLGESTNGPYTLIWSNAPAGDHLLRAIATDNSGLTYTSKPVEIFINTNGGSLTGTKSPVTAGVDLTADGNLDWAHWGLAERNSFDHKFGGVQQIPNFTTLGTNALQQLTDYPTSFSWSDGVPTPSSSGTQTGVFITGLANGFEFSIPASTTTRTLKLYVGLYGGQGNFQAFLNDFSAPAFTDSSLKSFYGNAYGLYTLNFAAASPNQVLKIRFVSGALYEMVYGNATVEAASLSAVVPPQPVLLGDPSWNNGVFSFSFATEANRTYTVEYTDSLSPASWQVLTNFTGGGVPVLISDSPVNAGGRSYHVIAQ
jgi:hypothetical protein